MAASHTCLACRAASTSADYCDSCGRALGTGEAAIAGGQSRSSTKPTVARAEDEDGSVAAGFRCWNCRAERTPNDAFCETCGLDFTKNEMPEPPDAPAPLRGPTWALVIAPDRTYFSGNQAESTEPIPFPEGLAPREVPLAGDEVIVGRSDEAKGVFPDIDLARLVGDPGVSRRHVVLHRQGDGSWAFSDQGSSNGTWLNDGPEPVRPGELVALHDGDRIQLGIFTVLTLRYHREGTS